MSADPYDPATSAETFDLSAWLAGFDRRLLGCSEGRRILTRTDPMLFAVVYLTHHLTGEDTGGVITFADAHFAWYRLMRQWVRRTWEPRQWRHSFAAPRSCAKSTVWFTIAPLWGGAHGHVDFVAAFADSGTQSEMHLQTFRSELAHNQLLREDYPEFCVAMRKPTGRTVSDNEGMYQSRSGFVFASRGADTASLGMKVGNKRPDVIILDDIEKHESQYSLEMVRKRLATIINAIFPLNERARVVIVGTTTRPGSIIHQLVEVADGDKRPEGETHGWIADERIVPHHYEPIIRDRISGAERSCWPAKWSLSYLKSIEGTRNYELNMRCNPRSATGDYWSGDDFVYGVPGRVGRVYCFVDPPVTTGKTSDPAGVVILGYLPQGAPRLPELLAARHTDPDLIARLIARSAGPTPGQPRPGVVIYHASAARLTGRPLMRYVAGVCTRVEAIWGVRVRGVLCEANQGGDLWYEAAEHIGIPFKTFAAGRLSKGDRFGLALDHYQAVRVFHAQPLPELENQAIAYPGVAHDDVVDAMAHGVLSYLQPRRTRRSVTILPS